MEMKGDCASRRALYNSGGRTTAATRPVAQLAGFIISSSVSIISDGAHWDGAVLRRHIRSWVVPCVPGAIAACDIPLRWRPAHLDPKKLKLKDSLGVNTNKKIVLSATLAIPHRGERLTFEATRRIVVYILMSVQYVEVAASQAIQGEGEYSQSCAQREFRAYPRSDSSYIQSDQATIQDAMHTTPTLLQQDAHLMYTPNNDGLATAMRLRSRKRVVIGPMAA
ncbi:uncharacterized protein BO96DRAFT_403437 [Aspergillus niger CBS 101883]|uniref:uncharacterized protein n=1 Tax=Aspergillus lacticoffeatus (strain CBS 101883) TaxID=1450533 RepID=UPI000D804F0F|nr:uncharacterized protein BO96DRAFT_403437 [Aspergillus niger CBS 101883]PYH51642.1 hypothetical protein BO96DRAFT_403437 [Aspergillus niger CBS 101883]